MASDDLFLSDQHPISRRWAVVEDDGSVAYLYLTERGSEKPVADCWLYNRVEAPTTLNASHEEQPVALATYVRDTQPCTPPKAESVSFRWSGDGESVAVLFHNNVQGFIAAGERRGFSRNLSKAGPFGSPLDLELYDELFVER
jgi:hypothetical protein